MAAVEQYPSSFLETILLTLIEEISFCTPQVDDFGATVPVFFLLCALFTIVSVGNTHASTDNAATLE